MLVNYKFILTIPGSVYHRATLQRTNTGGLVISNPGTLDRHYSLPADHNSFNRTGASLPCTRSFFYSADSDKFKTSKAVITIT